MKHFVGVSVDNIRFDVQPTEYIEGFQSYYIHSDARVDYTIYIGETQLKGQTVIPYEQYKKMLHLEIVLHIKEQFLNQVGG